QLPRHPALPNIRGTGLVGSAAYLAMDFPEGKLLSAALAEVLPPDALGRMAIELADALQLVHSDGVFHGELSSDSVLLLPDGRSILWDMPLVLANRLTDRRGEERHVMQLVHTAPY